MPTPAKKRDYKKEYARDHASDASKKQRAMRNKARSEAEKEGQVSKGDGMEVDHIKPLASGGGNGKSNRRVVTRTTNRTRAKPKRK